VQTQLDGLANDSQSVGIELDKLAVSFFRQKWEVVASFRGSLSAEIFDEERNQADLMLALSDDEVLALLRSEAEAKRAAQAERERQERIMLESRTTDEWIEVVRALEERIRELESDLEDELEHQEWNGDI
jgi:hypothetical protein